MFLNRQEINENNILNTETFEKVLKIARLTLDLAELERSFIKEKVKNILYKIWVKVDGKKCCEFNR